MPAAACSHTEWRRLCPCTAAPRPVAGHSSSSYPKPLPRRPNNHALRRLAATRQIRREHSRPSQEGVMEGVRVYRSDRRGRRAVFVLSWVWC